MAGRTHVRITELAEQIGVSRRTIMRWLLRIGYELPKNVYGGGMTTPIPMHIAQRIVEEHSVQPIKEGRLRANWNTE